MVLGELRFKFILISALLVSALLRADPLTNQTESLFRSVCPKFYDRVNQFVLLTNDRLTRFPAVYSGMAAARLSPRAFEIFDKVTKDSQYEPTADERTLLKNEGVERRFELYRASWAPIQSVNQFVALAARSEPARAPGNKAHSWDTLFGNLTDFPKRGARFMASRIYQELQANPKEFKPSKAQAKVLKDLGLTEDFETYRQKFIENPSSENLAKKWYLETIDNLWQLDKKMLMTPFRTVLRWLPLPTFPADARTRQIYEKARNDPHYVPSDAELKPLLASIPYLGKVLEKTKDVPPEVRQWYQELLLYNPKKHLETRGLTEDFDRFRAEAGEHPTAFKAFHQARRGLHALKWTAAAAAVAAGVIGTDYIDAEDSMNEDHPDGMSRYDEKVELMFTSPSPHVSIRIGGLVYNYGQGSVERMSLPSYVQSWSWLEGQSDIVKKLNRSINGSHTRVEIKMTQKEAAALRDRLEQDVGKNYVLFFPYNDCVSQTNRALRDAIGLDVPIVADRSQALTIAYLKGRRLVGDDRVGRVVFASGDKNVALQKAQDVGVNALDTFYFLQRAPTVAVSGPLIDTYLEPRDFSQSQTESK